MAEANSTISKQARALAQKDKVRIELIKERGTKGATKVASFPNPFVYEGPLWTTREVLVCLCGIVIFPLRMFVLFICMFLAWVFMKISISGDFDPNQPMTGWRRGIQYPVAYLTRFLMFCFGFYWVDTVGKPCNPKDARIVVCAPHSTIFDTLYLLYAYRYPSAISKIENLNLPLAGTSFRAMQAVAVDRKSRVNKDMALSALAKHAANDNQRHLLVFPEGTCTNRKALITFKRGAFVPGQPVQPVCLEWPWTGFDLSWTAAGPNRLLLALHAFIQPYLRLKVTFLPVYYPNDEEKINHQLFARNVRAEIAKVLGIPCTNHSYEDMFLAKEARKLRVPLDENMPFELYELSTLFSIGLDDAKTLLKRYASIYKNSEKVDGPGLAKILGIPYTKPVKELFELLKDDPESSEGIDFQELLIGVTQLSKALNTADLDASIELVWDAVSNGAAEVTEKEVYERLSKVFAGFDRMHSKRIFRTVDAEKKGKVDFEMFRQFIKERPELLFVAVETIAERQSGRRLSVLSKKDAEKAGSTNKEKKNEIVSIVAKGTEEPVSSTPQQ
jgi:lysophosphatidylcholine acyltransferase/lyso-PAF acetyltransferase